MQNIQCFLLDMDGTIYLSDTLIDGARDFIKRLRTKNCRYFFLTNNSSKNSLTYAQKLTHLGIPAESSEIFTSGEATTIYLHKKKPGARIFLMGTKALADEFTHAGFHLTAPGMACDFVVLGFDTTLTYEKLWAACDHIRAGVPFIATHPDLNCPLAEGRSMPDCGAMIAFIEAATGTSPIIIGKPNTLIIDTLCEKYNLGKENMMMVGDRLSTDILLGQQAGIQTTLVLSGETTLSAYKKSAIKADYVCTSIQEMLYLYT